MKVFDRIVLTLPLLAALGPGVHARARQFGGFTEVDCIGIACGGNGGSLDLDYVYEIHPNGNSITSFDVSIEDGDIDHYDSHGPADWSATLVSVARAHDYVPTQHGTVTDDEGTCSYVLRFSGPSKTQNFQVGFDYEFQGDGVFHDAHWKTSGNRQANWTFPVGQGKGPVHSPVRLNVLLIVLDDVGTDRLELFDIPNEGQHAYARVPTLEKLAEDGIQFTNFYVNPVCSTSRACFQTGRYAHRHGIGWLIDSLDGSYILDDCEVTLGELLKQGFPSVEKAYSTGAFGKWHLTPRDDEGDEVVFQEHAMRNGYDRFFGTLSSSGHFSFVQVRTDITWEAPETEWVQGLWSADLVRRDASEWIEAADEPFFAYVAFTPPHAPFSAPPEVTEDSRPLLSSETIDELGQPDPDDETFYRAMLEAVDSEIGYLLDDMDPAKRARTMVILASDNGPPEDVVSAPHCPNRAKGTVYQLGVRVPMIVTGPLAPHGVCDAAVGAVDLFDTIAAITGANADVMLAGSCSDAERDSVSFLPLIKDPSGPATRPAFSQFFKPNGFVNLTAHDRAVTDGHYKYVRRLLVAPDVYEHEFYDLIADPYETTNLAPPPEELQAIYDGLSSYMDFLEP